MSEQMQPETRSVNPIRILRVDASARVEGSVSRQLADELIEALRTALGTVELTARDLKEGLPFVDETWMTANFTPEEERTDAHRAALTTSDELVAELAAADALVISTPIYNFGIPAALKAWVDMVARARLTFRYTDQGPVGLLEGKRAYVIMASGGTRVGSEIDFASGYLRHVLGFLGIQDVEIIAADRLVSQGEASIKAARKRIDALLESKAA